MDDVTVWVGSSRKRAQDEIKNPSQYPYGTGRGLEQNTMFREGYELRGLSLEKHSGFCDKHKTLQSTMYRNTRHVFHTTQLLGRFSLGQDNRSGYHIYRCGENVTHLVPGDRVAIEPGVPCGKCRLCMGGKYNVCSEMRFCAAPPCDGLLRAGIVDEYRDVA